MQAETVIAAAVVYRDRRRQVEALSAYALQDDTAAMWDALLSAERDLLAAVDQVAPPPPAELARVTWLQRRHRAPGR